MYYQSEMLEYLRNKYNIKKGINITSDLVIKISECEHIKIKDTVCILQISSSAWHKLRTGKQKYSRINFNRYLTIKSKSIVKSENITFEKYSNLKSKMNVKDYTLRRTLGISDYTYKKFKSEEIKEVKIRNMKIKHIVDSILIDLKYLDKYGERYYSKSELEAICQKRWISLNAFLKYCGYNEKHYRFNKMIIEKNENGFWIGNNISMPKSFVENNYQNLILRLNKVVNKIGIFYNCKNFREDLVSSAMSKLYENCGNIIMNFYFDINLMFNILMVKAKYFMINTYLKEYKETKNIHFDEYENIDHIFILKDDTFNPEKML